MEAGIKLRIYILTTLNNGGGIGVGVGGVGCNTITPQPLVEDQNLLKIVSI